MKILIIKTSSLGDVIHALPVINDILAAQPNAQIDWVVEESFADIPRLHPRVSFVFHVAFRQWRKKLFSQKTWADIFAIKEVIQQNQYDAVIDMQGLLKSALITKQAIGPKHGYDKQSIREPIASWFYDKTYAVSYQQHAVTRNRMLVALSLGYKIPTNAPDYGIAAAKPSLDLAHRLPKKFVMGLHGTSRDSKLWPVENWVNLGKQLAHNNTHLVLPWASQAEFDRANNINNQLLNGFVMPKMHIAEVATVVAQAQAAIGVDTGLSHLAAALNIPTIAIYTDTNPQLTGVMAGSKVPAVNLGGIAQNPSVTDVLKNLEKMMLST